MEFDITMIIELALTVLAAIVTTVVLPRVKTWLDARTTKADRENILAVVRMAVSAAEQLYQSQTGEKLGAVKKEYVMELLRKQNLTMDYEALEAMVEAEVRKLNEQLAS